MVGRRKVSKIELAYVVKTSSSVTGGKGKGRGRFGVVGVVERRPVSAPKHVRRRWRISEAERGRKLGEKKAKRGRREKEECKCQPMSAARMHILHAIFQGLPNNSPRCDPSKVDRTFGDDSGPT